ncbi:MAG: tRNA pseudouridine(38-40) synthase TruA [Solirubrobacterales bacterium]|nr:tRNA pseudouridine(38-40) synthase TruA [Solirubrobacterales bacterium]
MRTYRLDVAYDGRRFSGWAAQPGLRTVQGELEEAMARVIGEQIPLTVAGRTDAGVHALGQVASFETARPVADTLPRALNSLTGHDLAITGLAEAPGFDARRHAVSRRYRYRVEAASPPSPFEHGRALHWPYPLDREALGGCAAMLSGTHDFTAFTPTETDHVRFEREVLEAGWSDEDDRIVAFEIEADAFMRNMVRILVGTMLEVGGGRRGLADFERLLAGAPRPEAGPTAPAHGLYLLAVSY